MAKELYLFLAIFLFVSCAAEQKAPQGKWEVKVTKESDQKIWVWKPDGSKQCDAPSKFTPERAAQEFRKTGISVFQFRKGSDGMMYPSVCGAGTGSTVELEISKMDLVKALQLGYKAR